MKSAPALSKLLLAFIIVFSSIIPAYASAEDVPVSQPSTVLFEDDFQDGNTVGWTLNNTSIITVANDPANVSNKMLNVSAGDEAIALIDNSQGSNYVYEAKVKKVANGSFPGILARYTDVNNYYMFQLGDGKYSLSKKVGGTVTTLNDFTTTITTGQWYTMRLVVEGSVIKAYVDNKLITQVTDTSLASGKAGFRSRWEKSGLDDVQLRSIASPVPTSPANVHAGDVTSTSVTLTWDSTASGANYRVYRSTLENSNYAQIYSGSATTYADTSLASGVTYYYRVSSEVDKYEATAATLPVTTILVLPATPDLLPGIVAAYTFDETSGTTASPTAASSNQTKANLVNGAAWTTGHTGGAVDLDGVNDHVTLPNGILNGLNDMTITTWVKQDTLKKWGRIFDIGIGTNNYIFLTASTDGDATRFVFKNGGAEQIATVSPAQQIANEWVHYAVTLSGSSAIMYVNGVEVARNNSVTIRPKDLGNTLLNYIGRSVFSADPYMDAKIDDFFIFNRSLGPAEVALFTAPEDTAKVAADTAALTLGDISKVMADLKLPAQGASGTKITWESADAAIISAGGVVTRPELGEPDVGVVLTATIKRGNAVETKTFNATVLAQLADADAVATDKAALVLPDLSAVTAKLTLPKAGPNQTVISWKSDFPVNLRPDGMVSRPANGKGDLAVTLTATITRGTVTETKSFSVTILEQDTNSGFLLAFTRKVSNVDTLFYAVSRNGRSWTELTSNAGITDIAPQQTFKLISEDKWYKYEYANDAWSLYTSTNGTSNWTKDTGSITLPSGAISGNFKPINETEWIQLVNQLSTPRTLDVLKTSTRIGFEPRLPDQVKIDYTNNLYVTAEVEWDVINSSKYAAVSTFTAAGTVKGTSTRVQASVTVIDDSAYSDTIRNGEFWYDDEGGMIQAHGGHIIKVEDTYYWFGEDKGHNSAVLKGVSIYASKDLKSWEYRNTVLTPLDHPELASAKIERPKILYNAKTGKYVLWGHWEESGNYNQANVIVAESDTVDGDYTYVNRFQPGGMQSRDFTVFQDDNGKAYLFSSSNNNADMNVFRLTDDYLYLDEYLYTAFPGGKRESPAIVKKDGIYYMFTSGLSGWYPNQGMYATTTNIEDKNAWSSLKKFGDPATYYTQSSFIVSVYGSETTSYVYVGDRWTPTALRESQYIWLPLQLDNGLAELTYSEDWNLDAATGHFETPKDLLVSQGKPVVASSSASGFGASAANDGNYDTYYDSGTTAFGNTWEVDLGKDFDLSRIDLSWREWNGSEVYYQYTIEGKKSSSDTNYEMLVDKRQNTTPSFNSDKLTGSYRYVKLTITGQKGHTNNAGNTVTWYRGLYEVKIYSSNMVLDTPTGLTAKAVQTSADTTSIQLGWGTVTNAANYEVFRSDSLNGDYTKIHVGSSSSYEDIGLASGKTYYYKVKAVHAGGESGLSAAVSAKTFVVPAASIIFDNRNNIWYDTDGNVMPIGSYLKVGDIWYYYTTIGDGMRFTDMIVYKSNDFKNWTLQEEVLLNDESHAELAASKLEALSVIYNKDTGKYVAWFHYENDTDYNLARVAAAVSDSPTGPFVFQGSFRPLGNDSRDLTTFVDEDGSAYLISSTNTNSDLKMYKLSSDYLTVDQTASAITVYTGKHREAPSLVKHDGVYFLFSSGAAGWKPTQGTYSTATSITGPWSEPQKIGNASTFGGQSGAVLTIQGTEATSYIMMSNQWKPADLKTSKRVWLPISFNGLTASYDYSDFITVDPSTGIVSSKTDGQLLSAGKPATASDWSGANRPQFANDGDYTTSWVGENNTWPKWWQVDLGGEYSLSSIQISWFLYNGSEAYHKFKVETSLDGIQYTVALDQLDNTRYGFTSDSLTGTARYVRVQLVDAVLVNNPSNWYTPQLGEVKVYGHELNAPIQLALEEATDSALTLSWKAIPLALGYNVYRSDSIDGSYVKVNSSAITASLYTDTNLTADTTYFYKVTAVYDSKESAQSSALQAATLELPNGVPSGLQTDEVTTSSVKLSWQSTDNTGTFNVYRSNQIDGVYVKVNAEDVAVKSYTDTELSADTTYYYKVSTVSNTDESELSSALEVKTKAVDSTPTPTPETTPTATPETTPTATPETTPTATPETTPTATPETTPTATPETTPTATPETTPTATPETTPTATPETTPTATPETTPTATPVSTPTIGGGSNTNNDSVIVTDGSIAMKTSVDGSGVLNARITEADLKKAIESNTSTTLQIKVDASNNSTSGGLKVTIPVDQLLDANQTVKRVAVSTADVTVYFGTEAASGILTADSKQVEVVIHNVKSEDLPESVRAQVGGHPVYDFTLSVDGKAVSEFNATEPITVEMKYTLQPGEKAHQIVIYYIGADGKLEVVRNAKFNEATGLISFKPKHFSRYAAAHAGVVFKDLSKAPWAQSMIEALAAREIVRGTGNDSFEPARTVTRAEFVQQLLGALGLIDEQASSNFGDVTEGAWYYAAVASAEKLGIVKGKANGSFGGGESITREDMAVMLSRAVELAGVNSGATSAASQAFKDQSAISAYAAEAVEAMQEAGYINGFTDGSYQPKQHTTRAQAASVIFKLLKL
ncbi:immunoglobulin-like domain-containing protein [Paenibacillus sinopodophylli]|uniref:immunoglobulin-like domain-containing protein n=1 Tax=Paenibacillus sinopodophylli TaxID=1837342 RepID=UPI00110CFD24|nr:immunoglobulin-like domain-containing protein [Paenibacillus sinopodophylli]